jgi:hypothetical protein
MSTNHFDVLRSPGRALQFKVSLAAFLLAIAATLALASLHVSVINLNLRFLESIEQNQIDELATIWLLAAGAAGLEIRHRRRFRMETERIHVLRATMRTVYDVVGNRLNELQLLRMEAEGLVSAEALSVFDEAIRSMMDQLRALTELNRFAERPMVFGPGLDFDNRLLVAA